MAKTKILADFKKKKVKVGKTIKSSTTTKINTKSKKINIPLQNKITSDEITSQKDIIEKFSRQLHHHKSSAKAHVLENCKNFLKSCLDPENHIALIVPSALEILNDEEKDTRTALISFMTAIFTSCKPSSFRSIVPVMVTYICSGLTSLRKSIRRDSLQLTLLLTTHLASVLHLEVDKIITNVLGLFHDMSLRSGPNSLISSSLTAGTGSAVSLILQVISRLLEARVSLILDNECSKVFSRMRHESSSSSNITPMLLIQLLNKLAILWDGHVIHGSVIDIEAANTLHSIVGVVNLVGQIMDLESFSIEDYHRVVDLILTPFPYQSVEETVGNPSSSTAVHGRRQVNALNTKVCDIVLAHSSIYSSEETLSVHQQKYFAVASSYIMDRLKSIKLSVETVDGLTNLVRSLQFMVSSLARSLASTHEPLSSQMLHETFDALSFALSHIPRDSSKDFKQSLVACVCSCVGCEEVMDCVRLDGMVSSLLVLLANVAPHLSQLSTKSFLLFVETVGSFYRHASFDANDSTSASKLTESLLESCFSQGTEAASSLRSELLSLYYYAPLEDLPGVTSRLVNMASRCKDERSQALLIRLVYERRREMNSSTLVNILVSGLLDNVRHSWENDYTNKSPNYFADLGEHRWMLHFVVEFLYALAGDAEDRCIDEIVISLSTIVDKSLVLKWNDEYSFEISEHESLLVVFFVSSFCENLNFDEVAMLRSSVSAFVVEMLSKCLYYFTIHYDTLLDRFEDFNRKCSAPHVFYSAEKTLRTFLRPLLAVLAHVRLTTNESSEQLYDSILTLVIARVREQLLASEKKRLIVDNLRVILSSSDLMFLKSHFMERISIEL